MTTNDSINELDEKIERLRGIAYQTSKRIGLSVDNTEKTMLLFKLRALNASVVGIERERDSIVSTAKTL